MGSLRQEPLKAIILNVLEASKWNQTERLKSQVNRTPHPESKQLGILMKNRESIVYFYGLLFLCNFNSSNQSSTLPFHPLIFF